MAESEKAERIYPEVLPDSHVAGEYKVKKGGFWNFTQIGLLDLISTDGRPVHLVNRQNEEVREIVSAAKIIGDIFKAAREIWGPGRLPLYSNPAKK